VNTPIPTSGAARHYDAIIVGGRLAGASTALLLARAGARVLVVERAARGADTLSTHALMRAGVHQLARWGVIDDVVSAGTPVLSSVVFHYPDGSLVIPVKPGPGYAGLYAPRRTVLDPALADAAAVAGADMRFETTVRSIDRAADGRVVGVSGTDSSGRSFRATAPIMIGADGTRSILAKAVDAPVLEQGVNTTAVTYTYVAEVPADGYEWGFAPGGATGVIPTNDDQALVFVGVPARDREVRMGGDPETVFWSVLHDVTPEVAERVRAGHRTDRFHRFPGLAGYLRQAHGPGWALVGDAGYFKDPISAHGMTDALVDAELLADAVLEMLGGVDEHAALEGYQALRHELSADLFRVTEQLAAHDRPTPRLKELLLELAGAMEPEMELLAGRESVSEPRAA
jgi:2-polyprenyl-6-methoxyphenol hydroxylase-like FAD-dependent oxidoreductase